MKINPRVATIREVVRKVVQILAERDIEVTQKGATAYCRYDEVTLEPTLINIPFIPDDANDFLIDAIHGFVDHELGHVFNTDPKELVRANRLGVANTHNALEDTFIEREQCKKFKGTATNLENVAKFFLQNYTDKKLKEDPANAVGYLMIPVYRAWAGQTIFQEYMDDGDKWKMVEKITTRIGHLKHKVAAISSTKDAVDLAVEITTALKGAPPASTAKKKERKFSEEERTGKKGSSEERDEKFDESKAPTEPSESSSGSGAASEPGVADEDDSTTAGGSKSATSKEEGDDEKFDEDKFAEKDSKFEGDGAESADDGHWEDHKIDEEGEDEAFKDDGEEDITPPPTGGFDDGLSESLSTLSAKAIKGSAYRPFTLDNDVIRKFDLEADGKINDGEFKSLQRETEAMVGVMQKDLERAIAAKSRSVWQNGLKKGRLNASSLAKLNFGDTRVFRKRDVALSKDVAVSLVCDNSGSMSGEKIELTAKAAFALSSVLDRMNITHEVIGFTTKGWSHSSSSKGKKTHEEMKLDSTKYGISFSRILPLFMPIYKEFDERLTPDNKKRIAAMSNANFLSENVDGECVMNAALRLAQRKESRHIMIVLSDGMPSCGGSSTGELKGHLQSVVETSIKMGIETIGIGVMTSAVKEFYPNYIVLDDVESLPTNVIKKLREFLLK